MIEGWHILLFAHILSNITISDLIKVVKDYLSVGDISRITDHTCLYIIQFCFCCEMDVMALTTIGFCYCKHYFEFSH